MRECGEEGLGNGEAALHTGLPSILLFLKIVVVVVFKVNSISNVELELTNQDQELPAPRIEAVSCPISPILDVQTPNVFSGQGRQEGITV